MNRFRDARYWLPTALAFLIIPLMVGAVAYTVATILREPEQKRWLWALGATGVTLIVVLAIILVKWLRKRSKAGKLEAGLAGGERAARNKGEIEALRKNWKESVGKLKGTAVAGGGSRALAALPWYVIIGAPASGKSTLLRQSGIDFPVGDAAIRGLQGTRNCDWWFSNVGVFLDTAGRYISDESAEEWAQFLDLVRQHRTGSPVNGVIVALPATDLLERSYEEQDIEAKRIRARLDELIDHLGVNFPVWIVVTKVDLIGGFVEFFGQADGVMRQQMMGWTLDQGDGARFNGPDFDRRFAAMIHRLREIRPSMVGTSKLRDRPAAFAFPDELAACAEPLNRMLQRIFEPNVYQETPLFRGVYITSATQQGTPLQRAAARVREQLGAPRIDADAQGALIKNAYFVKDLMHERIVQDQNMTWTTQREVERGKHKRMGINLIGCSIGLLFFMTVLAFGLAASKELGAVETQVDAVAGGKGGATAKADALWLGAQQANDDNYRNLGLSQQKSLRQDLTEKQREVYRDAVLVPILKGYLADMEAVDVRQGLKPAVDLYAQFGDTVAALNRAADHDAKIDPDAIPDEDEAAPDTKGGKGGGKGEKAAPGKPEPPDPSRAPRGFFPPKQRKSFEDRRDRLVAEQVIGKKRKDDRQVELLLDVIWRNNGGAADVKPEIAAVEEAFRKKVRDYFALAGAAVTRIENDEEARKRYITGRLEGFKQACLTVTQQFENRSVEMDALKDALKILNDAASGESAPKDASGGDPAQRALLDSIAPSLSAVETGSPPPVPPADLPAIEGYPAVKRFGGGTKAGGDDAADATVRIELNAVAASLRSLESALKVGDLVRPWPSEGAPTIQDALNSIEKAVLQNLDKWLADVEPHLAKLAGKDVKTYEADETRWARSVEVIEPTLRRNALYQQFLELKTRGGTFDRLADGVVRNRRAEGIYTKDALTNDLESLLYAVNYGESEYPAHLMAATMRDRAADLVQARFKIIVASAVENWDARIANIPHYVAGDAWGYIRLWTGGEGLAKTAQEVHTAWPSWELDQRLKASVSVEAARKAWNETAPLRNKLDFLGARFDTIKRSLVPLAAREQWNAPLALDKLRSDLGASNGRPVWDIRSEGAAGGSGAIDTAVRTELTMAVREAEDEIVHRVEKYFDDKWDGIRKDLIGAVADASKERLTTSQGDFDKFVKEMTPLFGDTLTDKPGGRLSVTDAFRTTRQTLRNALGFKKTVTQGFDVFLTCTLVPHSKNADNDEKYPYLVAEYKEDGQETQTHRWEPSRIGDRAQFSWHPGKGKSFVLKMQNERGDGSKPFKDWSGPTSLIDAIRDGGGGGSDVFWHGTGEYTGADAKFQMTVSNPDLLRQLLSPDSPDPSAGFASDCIQVTERR